MNIAPLSQRVQAKVGITGQVRMALGCCRELTAALHEVFVNGRGAPADVAHAIAGVEIMCAQLRDIVGHAKVDLETAERLHTLQGWIADLEENDAAQSVKRT
ncbi:hypothetical protein AB3X91_30750 [Paraburkholderia sp. BR14263]|uniref:hypothetical protein n=1 Tax=unclassified Paraburkholderia TaxID=2615204 RepID=UPI0034CFCCB1